jgi:release factor glutamine methyltransferase
VETTPPSGPQGPSGPSPHPAVSAIAERLLAAGCVAPEEEAEELLAAAPDPRLLEHWLNRRERGEPLAWITGRVEFCGRWLQVAPPVYVPRVQTEELARRAATRLPDHGRAADLCTGAGPVAAHLQAEVPTARVVGVELELNAARCAAGNGVRVVVGDLDLPIRPGPAFDVVTAVPPYVPTGELRFLPADVQRYEPRAALDGGSDGLEVARRVVAAAGGLLRPGGSLFVELGGEQDEALAPSLAAAELGDVEPWYDEDGELRGLSARKATGPTWASRR